MDEKTCTKCGETKPLDEFAGRRGRRSGRDSRCKACKNDYMRAYVARSGRRSSGECSIPGCGKPSRSRGWCSMHYTRWKRHGSPDDRFPATCTVGGCERPFYAKGMCAMHYKREDPNTNGRYDRRGEKNPGWVGDAAGYGTAHGRVFRAKGSASQFACVACCAPADQWAYDNADADEKRGVANGSVVRYSLSVEHYVPMCISCHKPFDAFVARSPGSSLDEWLAEQAELDDLTEDELDDLIDAEIDRWTQPKESK